MERPSDAETAEYYHRYIHLVADGPLLGHLERQGEASAKLFDQLDDRAALRRYAPDKWSVKQVLGHVIDTERMFGYRALAFARRDPSSLPSFEQDEYVEHARFDARPWADLVAEYRSVRAATLTLFSGFDDDESQRAGMASGCSFTVRGVAWIVAGHELHHLAVLRERYGVG